MCEETKCDWKCKKPARCQRPKCELVCEKPACAAKKIKKAKKQHNCCQCSATNIKASMIQAGEAVSEEMTPSFIEVMHHMKHVSQITGEPACCGCE